MVYGIANPGGSDLIGISTVLVTPEMVGKPVALFVAMEVKTPAGRVNEEQQRFVNFVRRAGGLADIVRSPEDALRLVRAG